MTPDALIASRFFSNDCKRDVKCWEITLKLRRPNKINSVSITFTGSEKELSGDIGLFLYNEYADERDQQNNPFVPTQDLPKSLVSLEKIVSGFDDLGQDVLPPICDSTIECLDQAERAFEEALRRDETSPFAQLGRGLISLRRAGRLIERQGRMHAIESCLRTAGLSIRRAIRGSARTWEYLNDPNWRSRLIRAFPPHKTDLSELWQHDINYSCATRFYREALYKEQLRFSGPLLDTADLPPQLRDSIFAYALEARANVVNGPEIVAELETEWRQNPRSWAISVIFASQACRWKVEFGRAMQAIDTARDLALQMSMFELMDDAEIWRAFCLRQQDHLNEAERIIGRLTERYLPNSYAQTDEAVTIYIDLGYYFVHSRELRRAADYLGGAARANFINVRVAKDPILEPLRKDPEALAVFRKKLDQYRLPAPPQRAPICRPVQLPECPQPDP